MFDVTSVSIQYQMEIRHIMNMLHVGIRFYSFSLYHVHFYEATMWVCNILPTAFKSRYYRSLQKTESSHNIIAFSSSSIHCILCGYFLSLLYSSLSELLYKQFNNTTVCMTFTVTWSKGLSFPDWSRAKTVTGTNSVYDKN